MFCNSFFICEAQIKKKQSTEMYPIKVDQTIKWNRRKKMHTLFQLVCLRIYRNYSGISKKAHIFYHFMKTVVSMNPKNKNFVLNKKAK